MSKKKSKEQLIKHKDTTIKQWDSFLTSLIENVSDDDSGKADKLSYWLSDYKKYIDYETRFSPASLKRYKRGDVIKVNLGFNIGREFGGLHYAIVLDKNNSIYDHTLLVVPLTSVKPYKDLSHLRKDELLLYDEIFRLLDSNCRKIIEKARSLHNQYSEQIRFFQKEHSTNDSDYSLKLQKIRAMQQQTQQHIDLATKMMGELSKMKLGSIALIGQITTISKIRIYDPCTGHDVLSKVRVSSETLDKIDSCIIQNYIGK